MTTIAELWQAIENQYAAQGALHLLKPGASAQALDALEAQIGQPLPADLRESLLRHDGSTDSGWVHGELLSVAGRMRERAIWMELLESGTFADLAQFNADEPAVQPGWWHPGWLPLDADGGGNGAFVDLAPGRAGQVGQVRDMDHEVGPGAEAHSLAAYLQRVLQVLESGEYRYYRHAEDDFEGMCTADEIADFEDED